VVRGRARRGTTSPRRGEVGERACPPPGEGGLRCAPVLSIHPPLGRRHVLGQRPLDPDHLLPGPAVVPQQEPGRGRLVPQGPRAVPRVAEVEVDDRPPAALGPAGLPPPPPLPGPQPEQGELLLPGGRPALPPGTRDSHRREVLVPLVLA